MTQLLEQVYNHPLNKRGEIDKLIATHEKVSFKKGDILLKEGQIANEYYILESGLMRSYVYDYKGDDITITFFSSGELLIEVSSLFQRIPTKENIEALTDCVCWKMQFDAFQALYHSMEGFNEWGRAWLSGRLFHCKQRSISMITQSASDRYLALLRETPEVFQHAPLKCIATYLGVTDTSLSRIRKEIITK